MLVNALIYVYNTLFQRYSCMHVIEHTVYPWGALVFQFISSYKVVQGDNLVQYLDQRGIGCTELRSSSIKPSWSGLADMDRHISRSDGDIGEENVGGEQVYGITVIGIFKAGSRDFDQNQHSTRCFKPFAVTGNPKFYKRESSTWGENRRYFGMHHYDISRSF